MWYGHPRPKTLETSTRAGRRPPGRPRQRWLDNVIRNLQELDMGVKWERLAQDRMIWRERLELYKGDMAIVNK